MEAIIRAVQSDDIGELQGKPTGCGPKILKAIIQTLRQKGKLESKYGDRRTSIVHQALSALGINAMETSADVERVLRDHPDATADTVVKLVLALRKT